MGHWAWGMGHWALGIGHGALGNIEEDTGTRGHPDALTPHV
ncbi:hypothetical protein NIES2100_53200 [Calothrix sp. NIES-2100]|nr:hypothetical protein NIES2100_53200 [Calothrix sp. NIES-2100]